jgi:hypothetical protein
MSADDLERIPFARTLAGQAIASAGAGNDHQTLSANPILKPHLLPAKIKWWWVALAVLCRCLPDLLRWYHDRYPKNPAAERTATPAGQCARAHRTRYSSPKCGGAGLQALWQTSREGTSPSALARCYAQRRGCGAATAWTTLLVRSNLCAVRDQPPPRYPESPPTSDLQPHIRLPYQMYMVFVNGRRWLLNSGPILGAGSLRCSARALPLSVPQPWNLQPG